MMRSIRKKQDNMEYESLSMLSLDAVPEDAAVVLINAPSSDLGDDETDALIAYLQGGGNVVLTTDYIEDGSMGNLLRMTAAMGLTVEKPRRGWIWKKRATRRCLSTQSAQTAGNPRPSSRNKSASIPGNHSDKPIC